jgi:hypothetical protein
VLDRANQRIVGRYEQDGRFGGHVVPFDRRVRHEVNPVASRGGRPGRSTWPRRSRSRSAGGSSAALLEETEHLSPSERPRSPASRASTASMPACRSSRARDRGRSSSTRNLAIYGRPSRPPLRSSCDRKRAGPPTPRLT